MKARYGDIKYWIRIRKHPLSEFGKGETKSNPIKLKSLKQL